MKHKIFYLIIASLAFFMTLKAQTPSNDGKLTPSDSVRYATQLRSDSMRYAAEVKIEQLKIQAYKDSMIYSNLSRKELYNLKCMEVGGRFYEPVDSRFARPEILFMILSFVTILLIVHMIISARERGKRRNHEYRMAQLEKGLQEKIIIREQGTSPEPPYEGYEEKENTASASEAQSAGVISAPLGASVKEYLSLNTKYRRRGVIFILCGVAVMVLFWSLAGLKSPWALGWIPLFIGAAFLYLDYVSIETKKREWKRYQNQRSFAERTEKEREDSSAQEVKE